MARYLALLLLVEGELPSLHPSLPPESSLLPLLPPTEAARISKKRRQEDRVQSALGWLLLQSCVKQIDTSGSIPRLARQQWNGRPYVMSEEDGELAGRRGRVDVSLSHHGNAVAAAAVTGGTAIGLDIVSVKAALALFSTAMAMPAALTRFLSEEERRMVAACRKMDAVVGARPSAGGGATTSEEGGVAMRAAGGVTCMPCTEDRLFGLLLWVAKEALGKAAGCGLHPLLSELSLQLCVEELTEGLGREGAQKQGAVAGADAEADVASLLSRMVKRIGCEWERAASSAAERSAASSTASSIVPWESSLLGSAAVDGVPGRAAALPHLPLFPLEGLPHTQPHTQPLTGPCEPIPCKPVCSFRVTITAPSTAASAATATAASSFPALQSLLAEAVIAVYAPADGYLAAVAFLPPVLQEAVSNIAQKELGREGADGRRDGTRSTAASSGAEELAGESSREGEPAVQRSIPPLQVPVSLALVNEEVQRRMKSTAATHTATLAAAATYCAGAGDGASALSAEGRSSELPGSGGGMALPASAPEIPVISWQLASTQLLCSGCL